MEDGIGIGWSFPPHFYRAEKRDETMEGKVIWSSSGVWMTTGEAEINGSLAVLFSTRLGERLFRPDFGSSLEDFQFQPMDAGAVNQLKSIIEDAVSKYETRINIRGIDISGSNMLEGRLHVVLYYTIRGSNGRRDDSIHLFTYDSI